MEGRGETHGFYLAYHEEAGVTVSRRDMRDSWGRSSEESGGNVIGYDIHRETAGKRSTVGSVATNI